MHGLSAAGGHAMSEHTPGPWRTNGEGVFRDCIGGVAQIAHIGSAAYGDDEKSSNAALIAAAPDMLAELEDMTDVAEKAIIASGTDSEFAAIRVERARAAIAKAKGRP